MTMSPRVPPLVPLAGTLLLPLAGALLLALGGPARALDYVDATPTGAPFPQWDGGDTELEFADMNGDGHVDVISIGDHGSPYINTDQHGVMVYFSDGAGGWSIHMEGNFGYGGIAAGDVDNDGHMDVGYGMHHDYSGTDFGDQLIEVALGDGTGTSWTPWDDGLATSGEDWGMAATDFADFDHDGDLDLVSNSFGCCNGVRVYRNLGDGTWEPTYALSGGNATCFACCGDVNGDGHPDFAASYQHGCVFLGDGTGGFTPGDAGLPSLGTLGLRGVALGDVDRDGCQDLAFVTGGGVRVYVWRTDHWEDASAGLPATGVFEAAQLWDMNADGFVDLAAMGDSHCRIWLGDGSGGWTDGGGFDAPAAHDTGAFRVGGDIDHNGYADVAFLQEEGSWPSYRNRFYVYRESSVPADRFVRLLHPQGAETFLLGSVQTIRWCAARLGPEPAEVMLELSASGPAGPWLPIAVQLPDNGRFQWTVSGPITDQAHLRITLTQGTYSAQHVSGPFRLISTDPARTGPFAGPAHVGLRLHVAPNPALGGATLRLMGEADAVEALAGATRGLCVTIHDPSGRQVRRLPLAGGMPPAARWDGCDSGGARLPAGLYHARLRAAAGGTAVATRFVILP